MKQITLVLSTDYQRPVAKLADFHGIEALIDTGAVYPIWTKDERRLEKLGAVRRKESVPFGGLGGMTEGALYEIPIFQIDGLIYPNMGIIAHRLSFPVPLILPATMFNNLIYEINNKTHRMSITVPDDESTSRRLTIRDVNGRLHVFCSWDE